VGGKYAFLSAYAPGGENTVIITKTIPNIHKNTAISTKTIAIS